MTLPQLEERYAWNARRRALLWDLEEEFSQIARCSTGYRVVIFGSYLTNEPEPGDIDLIIAYDRKPGEGDCGSENDVPFLHKAAIQIKCQVRIGCTTPLPSAHDLVADFNAFPANASSGIRINSDGWAELVA